MTMNELSLWRDYEWEQFCSSEINSVLEQVEYIRIDSNPPRNLLEFALTRLSQTIKFFTHLSCIQLDGLQKDLDPRLLSTVCGALLQSTAQQKIKVQFNFGETSIDDNFLPVANLMKNCKREIVIDIRGGHTNEDETLALFADALRHLSGAVKELTLGSIDVGDDAACALAENLKVNATLDSLSLENNDIGVKRAKALASALKYNSSVTKLNLTDNSIGDEGAKALAGALKHNSSVTKLNLTDNSIGDEGAKALAGALKHNSSVTELYLACHSIGDEGAKALAGALKQNGALTTLNLSENSIGNDGAEALAGAVKENGALMMKLDLSWNSIGDDGAEALARALKQNGALTELDLSGNSIGDEGAIALGEAIAYNVTLDSLDLRHNHEITEKVGIEALVNGLNRNSTLMQSDLSREHTGIEFALRRNKALLKEPAWMKRFSDQDIVLKNKVLPKAMERYSTRDFMELTYLFLKSQVSMIAETDALADPAADE